MTFFKWFFKWSANKATHKTLPNALWEVWFVILVGNKQQRGAERWAIKKLTANGMDWSEACAVCFAVHALMGLSTVLDQESAIQGQNPDKAAAVFAYWPAHRGNILHKGRGHGITAYAVRVDSRVPKLPVIAPLDQFLTQKPQKTLLYTVKSWYTVPLYSITFSLVITFRFSGPSRYALMFPEYKV